MTFLKDISTSVICELIIIIVFGAISIWWKQAGTIAVRKPIIWGICILVMTSIGFNFYIASRKPSNFKIEDSEIIRNEAYEGKIIFIDGKSFINCKFNHSKLIFLGAKPYSMMGCSLKNCDFLFGEYAQLFIEQMHELYQDPGMKEQAEIVFDAIRHGVFHNKY